MREQQRTARATTIPAHAGIVVALTSDPVCYFLRLEARFASFDPGTPRSHGREYALIDRVSSWGSCDPGHSATSVFTAAKSQGHGDCKIQNSLLGCSEFLNYRGATGTISNVATVSAK